MKAGFFRKAWSAQEDEKLKEVFSVLPRAELSDMFGRSFSAVAQRARVLDLHRYRKPTVWTPEKIEKLKELYPRMTNREIGKVIGVTESAVYGKSFVLGLRKDKDWMWERSKATQYRKGCVPPNKGKKWSEYMPKDKQERCRTTQFKKGHVPHNKKPVGYERKTVDGYWEVKVAEPNVFEAKHRIIWEKQYGPIPDGMNVSFRDGNKENFDIGNLMLEDNTTKFNRCCSYHTNMPEDLRKMIQLKGVLKRQINKIDRRKEDEDR